MYKSMRRVQRFNLLEDAALEGYEKLLNNPQCTIISERQIKQTEREYHDGELIGTTESIFLVVTWEERHLL